VEHKAFIQLIEEQKWLTGLPKRNWLLLQFQEKYHLDRKQLLDKYNSYTKDVVFQSVHENKKKEQQMMNYQDKRYKIHNIKYDKDGIRFTKYGYCMVAGCKGAIQCQKVIVPTKKSKFNQHHIFTHISHPHTCDKRKGRSYGALNVASDSFDDKRVLFSMSRIPGLLPANVNEIVDFLESCTMNNEWKKLAGGNNDRFYLPNLHKSQSEPMLILYNMIQNWIPFKQTKELIGRQYPLLTHIRITVIKSLPLAVTQNGTDGRLHFDYGPACLNKHTDLQPISVMIALSSFQFIYNDGIVFQDEASSRDTIRTVDVPAGHFITFTNRCHHTGGPNNSTQNAYRIFLYCVSQASDFPSGKIYYLER
jgi:hypothetical protein